MTSSKLIVQGEISFFLRGDDITALIVLPFSPATATDAIRKEKKKLGQTFFFSQKFFLRLFSQYFSRIATGQRRSARYDLEKKQKTDVY